MVLNRIDWIKDVQGVYDTVQTGFRKHLGTQDSLALIRESIHGSPPKVESKRERHN